MTIGGGGVNVDRGDEINAWLKDVPISKTPAEEQIITKNGFEKPDHQSIRAVQPQGNIGYLGSNGSNVQGSDKYTMMFTTGLARANGRDITRDNFTRAAVTFSIRRSVFEVISRAQRLWVRDKDVFTTPPDDLLTEEFITDCVIYSLFNKQSRQTSLRNYQYNGNTFQVYNEFFPFSRKQVETWAIDAGNYDVQVDLANDNQKERFVHEWLQGKTLSPEATAVLDIVTDCYEKSFVDRAPYDKVFPRYQTNNWDQGWLSIRTMMFGRDRVNDTYLPLRPAYDSALTALGEKIATAAMDAGVI